MSLHEIGVAHHAGRTIGDQSAGIEQDDAIARVLDKLQIMRGDEFSAGQRVDQFDQFTSAAGIEEHRWLVEKQRVGPHREHTRDGRPSLFAAGEAEWHALFLARHADAFERFADAHSHIVGGQSHIERTEGHIVADGAREELIVRVLKDDAEMRGELLSLRRIAGSRPATWIAPGARSKHAA